MSIVEEKAHDLACELVAARAEIGIALVDVEIMKRFSPTGQVRCDFPAWLPSVLQAGEARHVTEEDMPRAVMRSFGGYREALDAYRAAGEPVIGDGDLEQLEDWMLAEGHAQFIEDLHRMLDEFKRGVN